MSDKPIEVFFSYAHEDEPLRDEMAKHLASLKRQGLITAWHDRQIPPGSEWDEEIKTQLKTADIILLLISADSMASDYCTGVEMRHAVERHDRKEACVIPIILRPCDWDGAPFSKLQALPKDARAVTRWEDRDEAFVNIVEGIKAAIKQINARAPGRQQAPSPSGIWNVPHLRNPNFTGREEELKALRASLLAGETAALVQTQAITGLGGVGKTQLATEYAYRHGAAYTIVWWVRSEEPTTLASDYAGLAAKLDLPEKDATEQRVIVEAVKEWLRQNQGWLLIFDNAEDVKLTRDYIPPGNSGHVIITSRNPNWKGMANSLSVNPLPLQEATQFLLNRTGQQDEATARTLAEELGRLPLALEQASAYMDTSGCAMSRYLKLFKERQGEMLHRGKPSTEYPDTVETTWSLSFQNVERDTPVAAELLRLCAFFAPDDIPLKMLIDGTKELPKSLAATVTDDLLLDEALSALRQYSLIKVENEKLTIHRLVQAVIRSTMDEATFKQWAGVAVHVVNASFPQDSDDVRTWPICAPLLPHASTALSHAEAIQFASNKTARLFNEVGLYLATRAEYAQAKHMYEHALALNEKAFGPDATQVATNLDNLAGVLQAQGDLAGAKALVERALAIDEVAFGPTHPKVAIRLNNLGLVLKAQGDLSRAKALYERAITIGEAILGPTHPKMATRLGNLAGVLRAQGDLNGAKALYQRALTIDEAVYGPDHPAVAIDINNLGGLLREQGNLASAKALFERSLRIFREFLGDAHPLTKMAQKNLEIVDEELKNAEQ
ncbi:MAG TPA: FxSxx-COOH system tetratricopeptide repeat protein [Blastocatellia bacterium]|nr:FxSxx-COOH system tetratricopeptide repeat protein [Blastocatellia bacterium]